MRRTGIEVWYLVLLALLTSCNPYWREDKLPAAKCISDFDCQSGESCDVGYCALVGWVTGKLHYTDPNQSDEKAVRLVVVRIVKGNVLLRDISEKDEILAQVDGTDLYRLEGLPRGELQLMAICRDTGRVAGSVPFTIKDRQGFRVGVGLARDNTVDLAVDLVYCED